MNTFEKSRQFDSWLKALRDTKGKVRFLHRIVAAENGNFGDWKPVAEGAVGNSHQLRSRLSHLLNAERRQSLSAVGWRRQVQPKA